ncbi:MAG: adenine phosphoribosyltransferase [Parcubacteria group bacterium]|jgi:adenine phosphoribosyltransferase|nr:adenine phosphoribosyltransferase [Parcubacteria group bacterium]|tara:strand:+ start:588 stop:1118 length:531 start_codon:yes stop_codon:yes gene_type:complete
MLELKSKIREIPDWPKKGVNFKDITTLLQDKDSFKQVIDLVTNPLADKEIDKIVGIDARGFLIAAPVAYKLNLGLAIVRKKGKLPYLTIEKKYILEYASNAIEMHQDAILKGEQIVLIDDLLATGGTALAACDLIEELGGVILETCFVVDLPFLNGSKKLKQKGYKVRSLVSYESE